MNLPIRVETHFLSCGNRFLLFNLFFNKGQLSLKLEETHYFWGEILFPLTERDFLSGENCFLLFRASFLQVKSVTETS